MKSMNYIVIQGWMCNELELKGNDLLVFALIYGFSQDGETRFFGNRNYIADTFNISLPTVDKAIESLRTKNLIVRYVITDNYGTHYEYEVCKETLQGVVKKLYGGDKETLHGGSKETLLNNTNKQNNKKINKTNFKELVEDFEFGKQKPKKESLYTRCVAMIDDFLADNLDKDTLKPLLVQYLNLRLEMRDKPIYANQWKGLLNKLQKVFVANPSNDMEDIIRQSIERGYASFFPVKSYLYTSTSKPWEDDVRTSKYSNDELRELEELDADRRAKGLRTKF